MYNFIKEAHSGWAYLVLLLLLVAGINALIGFSSNKTFTAKDRKISLFGLIATHVQLLLAMILYFISKPYEMMKEVGMGAAMKNDGLRMYLVEHPFLSLVAIILVTIGWSKHKAATTDKAKFKSIWLLYLIGFVFALVSFLLAKGYISFGA